MRSPRFAGTGAAVMRSRANVCSSASPLDTVLDAGKYHRSLGVIVGILAVDQRVGTGKPSGFGVAVLAVRRRGGLALSRDASDLGGLRRGVRPRDVRLADRDGATLADAWRLYGKEVRGIPSAAYRREEVGRRCGRPY